MVKQQTNQVHQQNGALVLLLDVWWKQHAHKLMRLACEFFLAILDICWIVGFQDLSVATADNIFNDH